MPSMSTALISALPRALRAVIAALADVAVPAQYGLNPAGSGIRVLAEDMLEMVFCVRILPFCSLPQALTPCHICSRNPLTSISTSSPHQHLNKRSHRHGSPSHASLALRSPIVRP